MSRRRLLVRPLLNGGTLRGRGHGAVDTKPTPAQTIGSGGLDGYRLFV